MNNKYNAAPTQTGFQYQTLCAVYFFLLKIESIACLNNEGQDDFDIVFQDGSTKFFQVKEIQNSTDKLTSQKIKDSLKTFTADVTAGSKITELGIVTNTSNPLGKSSRPGFANPYFSIPYTNLTPAEKKQIDNGNSSSSKSKLTDSDLEKITITKIHYDGNDTDSKYQELLNKAKRFIGPTEILESQIDALLNEWLLTFERTAQNPKVIITKEKFTSITELVALDSPKFDDFFDFFDDDSNEDYIKNEYRDYLAKVCLDFQIRSEIDTNFREYQLKNRLKEPSRTKRRKNFIEEYAPTLGTKIGLQNSSEDISISRLIIWLLIRQGSLCHSIEELVNIDY